MLYDFQEEADTAYSAHVATAPSVIAVDTETTGTAWTDTAFGVSVGWDHDDGDYRGYWLELSEVDCSQTAGDILANSPVWVFHNAKFDLQKLILAGIIPRSAVDDYEIHDTEAIAHLLDENTPKGLKSLAVHYLGMEEETVAVEIKSGPNKGQTKQVVKEKFELDQARRKLKKKVEDGYACLPREVVVPYARKDATMTIQLFDFLEPQLRRMDEGLQELYAREMELMRVLLDMEAAGLRVDLEYVQETARETAKAMLLHELELRTLADEEEFIDHHLWIKRAFARHGITVKDTQKDTIKTIDHPLAEHLLEYRRLQKLHSTYLSAILEETDEVRILHPGFRQHGTRTGRMSGGGVRDE